MQRQHLFAAALALACSAPLAAQFDFDLEKRTPGTLGQNLDLDVVGASPATFALLLPSTTAGPTPLFLIDPNDPRSMSVGTDLLSLVTVLLTDGSGNASNSLLLPSNPAISGFELHWQAIELLLGASFFGGLSNDVVTLTGVQDVGGLSPDTLTSARALAAGLVDADNNASANDVLVTGGGSGSLTSATGLATTERWDFRRMQMVPGPTMSTARAVHSAVRLDDDRVLLIGGADQNGNVLASCEIYDPTTDSFSSTGSMGTPRILFGACKLADGRVMVAGGTSTLTPDVTAAISGTQNSAEIYNPTTGTWSNTSAIGGRRLAPALTLLSNGLVMTTGGVEVTFLFSIPIGAVSTTAAQLWNPSTGSWSNAASMPQGRAGHQYNQVTLNDGRVLMTGGVFVPNLLGAVNATPTSGAEVYNPGTNSWTVANMPVARALHSATVLADGRVAVCGGSQGSFTAPTPIANVELFDPTTNAWTVAPPLSAPRASQVANLMPDGMLVLFGGQGSSASLSTIETLRF